MKFFSDYMDEACETKTGHTNWSFINLVHPDEVADGVKTCLLGGDIESIIVIYKYEDEEEHGV